MHKNKSLLEIVDIVRDYDVGSIAKDKVGWMLDYIDLPFRLYAFSEDTIITCLLDELTLRAFLVKT